MTIYTQWWRHAEAWCESGLSQADYCRQQGFNPKTFLAWTRRVRRELSMDKGAPFKVIFLQVTPSVSVATAQASIRRRLEHGARFELSTAGCHSVGWRSCCNVWFIGYSGQIWLSVTPR